MKPAISWTLGTVAFIALTGYFVVAEAPASKALSMVKPPAGISLDGVSGEILDGRAKVLNVDKYSYENVGWKTSIFGLLSKSFDISIADPKGLSGTASVQLLDGNKISLTDVDLKLSISNFLKYTHYSMPVDISGGIGLDVDEAVFGQKKCNKVNGKIKLSKIDIFTPLGGYVLGDAVLELNCRNGVFVAKLSQDNEYFGIDGNLEYDMSNRGYKVRASAKPKEAKAADIKPILEMIGTINSQGAYEIKYEGTFTY